MSVRPELVAEIDRLKRTGKSHGWLYHQLCLKFEFDFARSELALIAEKLGYKHGWCYHQETGLAGMRALHELQEQQIRQHREGEAKRREQWANNQKIAEEARRRAEYDRRCRQEEIDRVPEWEWGWGPAQQKSAEAAGEYVHRKMEEQMREERRRQESARSRQQSQEEGKKHFHDFVDKTFNQRRAAPGCPVYILTHVQVLELSWPFTEATLKTQFRLHAMKTHPDRGGTTDAFQKVQAAYEVLKAHVRG